MKILSIDPGYDRIGCAVIKKDGGVSLLHSECFETDKSTAYGVRLMLVGDHIKKLIKKHKPDCVVMEKVFFSKNKKTAMQVAEVRGVCIYVSEKEGISVVEYTPNQIKSSVTGNGNANKKQVMRMIPHLITLDTSVTRKDDEYDAIAIGITHCATVRGKMFVAARR